MKRIKNKLVFEIEKAIIRFNNLYKVVMRQPIVLSVEDTINLIVNNKTSISRFGDGEFDIILGRTQGFQKQDKKLAIRLKEILKHNDKAPGFVVGLPDCFDKLDHFTEAAQQHWKIRLDKERYKWVGLLNTKYPYYSSQITRFYFDWQDKSSCEKWFQMLKSIWDNKDIIIVEGDKTRCGVGNDIFDNAKSIKRIICPAENAFSKYDGILQKIKEISGKDDLIFMALGPTATVLAYDLYKCGYWAFDAGHIDIEYEWMKQKTVEKALIKGKYVNEVKGGNVVDDINDDEYFSQIICNLS